MELMELMEGSQAHYRELPRAAQNFDGTAEYPWDGSGSQWSGIGTMVGGNP